MVVKYRDIRAVNSEVFNLPLLGEALLEKTFEIQKVTFGEGKFGEYAVVTVDGKNYRTSSVVLCKQLHEIADYIKGKGDTVEVTLTRKGQYYTFQ